MRVLAGVAAVAAGIALIACRRQVGRGFSRSYRGVGVDLGSRGERAGAVVACGIGLAWIAGGFLIAFVADG